MARNTDSTQKESLLKSFCKANAESGGGQPKDDSVQADKLKELEQALKAGKLDPKSGAGQKWYRTYIKKNAPKADEYKAAEKSKTTTDLFKEFVEAEHEKCTTGKKWSKSFSRIDSKKGTYKPFGKIVIDEGGWDDPEAVAGATRLAVKCLLMGGDWVKWDAMTERLRLRHPEDSWQEDLREHWELFRQETSDGGKKPIPPKPLKRTHGAGGGGDTPNKLPVKNLTDSLEGLMKKCNSIKVFVQSTQSQTLSLEKSLANDSEYEELASIRNITKLSELSTQLQASMSCFDQDFILSTSVQIRKKYRGEDVQLASQLKVFIQLEEKAKSLDTYVKKLKAMQASH
jgi:hypothetical protein